MATAPPLLRYVGGGGHQYLYWLKELQKYIDKISPNLMNENNATIDKGDKAWIIFD